MLRDMIREAGNVPTRLKASGERIVGDLGSAPGKLAERGTEARRWVRARLHEARESSERSLFDLHVSTLESASDLLERTEGMPVLERVGASARDLLGTIERATVLPTLADYDSLNVRQVMAALRDEDRLGVLRILRYESEHKNRKTILDAIDRELGRRARLAAVA